MKNKKLVLDLTENDYENLEEMCRDYSLSSVEEVVIRLIEKSLVKYNNLKNIEPYVDEFKKLWNLYPKKQGKEDAFESYVDAREKYSFEEIEKGLNDYIFYLKENEVDYMYIKQGSNWFKQKCWNDDYLVYKSEKKKPMGKVSRIMSL